jgi:hypothetical protein
MRYRSTLNVTYVGHQGVARPQVADGGGDLQMRRVAAVANSRKEVVLQLGVSVGITNPHRKK